MGKSNSTLRLKRSSKRMEPKADEQEIECSQKRGGEFAEPAVDTQNINLHIERRSVDCSFEDLPYELIQRILVVVPDCDLPECSCVCKTWQAAIAEQSFWRQKCERGGQFVEKYMAPYFPPDWREFYFKSPFARNLIKNCSGQDSPGEHDLKHWTILSNGGERWKIETGCHGSDRLPDEVLRLNGGKDKSFATSYGWCEREQVIDLVKEGFSEEMLDRMKPTIFVSEWYAARFDCGNTYEFGMQLLKGRPTSEDTKDVIVDSFSFGPIITPEWPERSWKQATHFFREYGAGVRFIRYWDKSKDNKFWAGHYGGKMAGSEVRFIFTREQDTNAPRPLQGVSPS
ncbi:F-box only protein 6-like [Lytechinus pictus]|uniref:F-box only protein 6-like n=1 Tax=Lytechinus pictus TaxID=7653 RepID=UPI0030B9B907